MSNFQRIFGPLGSPVPMSYLDDNFSQIESTSTSTVTLAGAGLVGFLASGAGATARTVQQKLRDVVSVKDYNAKGDGSTDDTAAIVAAIAANPGNLIRFPKGVYKITSTITINDDGTKLMGDGQGSTWILNSQTNGDAIVFTPASITTNTTYINNNGFFDIGVYRSTSATTGAGVRLTQCNGFVLNNVQVLDCPEGITQEGGQLNLLDNFKVSFSSLISGSPLAGSSLLKFTNKQALDASYRQAFTTQISNFILSGHESSDANLLIQGCDGLNFSNGYVSNAYQALLRIKPNVSGQNVSAVRVANVYFDGISQATGTQNGIEILDDGFAGASLVNDVDVSGITFCGNLQGKGLYSTHTNIQTITVDPSKFTNVAGTEIDVTGGDTVGWIGIPVPWTPAITFTTPGDLNVVYSTQLGNFIQNKDGSCIAWFSILTSTFTHSTASGNLTLTGLPVASATSPAIQSSGSMSIYNGIAKANYTQVGVRNSTGATTCIFPISAPGQGASTVTTAEVASGGTVVLQGFVTYPAGEGA